MDLKALQDQLPVWNIERTTEFDLSNNNYRMFQHALMHIIKATGKLADMIDNADHSIYPAFIQPEISKLLADIVICAIKMANVTPTDKVQLDKWVIKRIEE